MNLHETLFTGQPVVDVINGSEYVTCTKCGELTNVRGSAYFDPYQPTAGGPSGTYVHYKCLSDERMAEIIREVSGRAG
jgi:hypothetical protein